MWWIGEICQTKSIKLRWLYVVLLEPDLTVISYHLVSNTSDLLIDGFIIKKYHEKPTLSNA